MLTVVLTSYARHKNVHLIHRALQAQSVKPKLCLWDNNPTTHLDALGWDLYAASTENRFCIPRWHMAKLASTPYVAVMDDDLIPNDENFLGDVVSSLCEHPEIAAVGLFGVVLQSNASYRHCAHIPNRRFQGDVNVSLLKGRFVAFRVESIMDFTPVTFDCEDIEASAYLGSLGTLVVPELLSNRTRDLPRQGGLEFRPDHYDRREAARRRFFKC